MTDSGIDTVVSRALANHPCVGCFNTEQCKRQSIACQAFIDFLSSGDMASNTEPDLKYKHFVAAFIDSDNADAASVRAFYVWEREGFAGSFSCDANYDPRAVLDDRYQLIKTKSSHEARKLELNLNTAEASEISYKIRAELEGVQDMTCGELSMILGVNRKLISTEARRLVSVKALKCSEPRHCRVIISDRAVTTWSAA